MMTIIIGMEHEGKVYMGADSATSNSWIMRSIDSPKVFHNGELLIGFTSSWRMGQILQYQFTPPVRDEGETDLHYMVVKVVNSIRAALRDNAFAKVSENQESGGSFLIGYRGHLYEMQDDYSILQYPGGIAAVGIGYMVALGAMLALDGLPPRERIEKSLAVVGSISDGVLPPYAIEATPND